MSECCNGGNKSLLYACSGCSDVGACSDKTVRKLSKDGFGKMTCLAGVGARISGFVESAKGADENITIDGCLVACARKTLECIGVKPKSFILTEMGLIKGKTAATEEVVKNMSNKIMAENKNTSSGNCAPGSDCCCG
ncbi:MAG: putative zinc-binding protein [bacterium]|nr:putative zinc-binding protein [bacterium]MDD5756623.1 putative zinc-binding protein [bacterium]